MFNDWRVHHFHLGTNMRHDGFVDRTGPVLYAYVTEAGFYAINVLDHGKWNSQALIEILHRNWPELIAPYRLKVIGLSQPITDADIKLVRKHHITAPVEVDGAVYASPGGGIASSGMSVEAVTMHHQWCYVVDGLQKWVRENTSEIVRQAAEKGMSMSTPLHFQLKGIAEGRALVLEVNSKHRFILPHKLP
jgi:hypothetical protein